MKGVQMYEIYINQTKVILKSSDVDIQEVCAHSDQYTSIYDYEGNLSVLKKIIKQSEESEKERIVVISSDDYYGLYDDFKSFFKVVKACGGIVVSEDDTLLMIYRRGTWDLPKGKMDKGESKAETAIREVIEETGISGVEIEDALHITRHVYRNHKGALCIKKSYWYVMNTIAQPLVPQAEEDIEVAQWMKIEEVEQLTAIYPSIVDVIDNFKVYKENNVK